LQQSKRDEVNAWTTAVSLMCKWPMDIAVA